MIKFPDSKPGHLTFYCRTLSADKDTCNVRLFKLKAMNARKTKEIAWKPPVS